MPAKEQENERFPRILMSPQMKAFEVVSYSKLARRKMNTTVKKTLKSQIK